MSDHFDPTTEDELTGLCNRYRLNEGRGGLTPHAGLAFAARAQAADMAARDFFDHTSPDGFEPSERVGLLARDLCGFSGENIAEIYGAAAQDGLAFHEMWRNSAHHRENLLRPDYDHVGHGVLRLGDKTWAAQVFAQATIRLAGETPLRVEDAAELQAALTGAEPAFDLFQLSSPDGATEPGVRQLYDGQAPPPGVWRLRPHLRDGERAEGRRTITSYQILWGPIFVA